MKKSFWTILKDVAMAIGAVFLVFLGITAAKKITGLLRAGLTGKVDKPANWEKIPGDSTHILVQQSGAYWTKAELPPGVKADQVKAAGMSQLKANTVEVEIDHPTFGGPANNGGSPAGGQPQPVGS